MNFQPYLPLLNLFMLFKLIFWTGLTSPQLGEACTTFTAASADGKVTLGAFDQLQKHFQILHCDKVGKECSSRVQMQQADLFH